MEEPVDSAGPAQLKRGESCRLRVPSGFGHGSRAGHASSRPAVGARHSGTAAGRRRWSPARKRLNGRASSQIRRPWEVIHAGSVSVYRRSVLLSLLSATHRLCPPPATPGQRSASLLGRQKGRQYACPSVGSKEFRKRPVHLSCPSVRPLLSRQKACPSVGSSPRAASVVFAEGTRDSCWGDPFVLAYSGRAGRIWLNFNEPAIVWMVA